MVLDCTLHACKAPNFVGSPSRATTGNRGSSSCSAGQTKPELAGNVHTSAPGGGGGWGGGGLGGGGDGGSGLHRGHIGSKFCTNTRVIGRWQHT